MSIKAKKTLIIAASQGATSLSKTLKQTMVAQQPSLVAMAATSTTTRDNGRRALVAAGGHGSFILETLKQTKAPRTVVEPIWEEGTTLFR